VRGIVGVAVSVVYWITDKIKEHLWGNLVAQNLVPERAAIPVEVECWRTSKERSKRDPSIGRHQSAICGKNNLRRPSHCSKSLFRRKGLEMQLKVSTHSWTCVR